MKLLVDKLPKTPKDCIFAIHAVHERRGKPKHLVNCGLKRNIPFELLMGSMTFTYTPNEATCSLCADKKCPFLKEDKGVINNEK